MRSYDLNLNYWLSTNRITPVLLFWRNMLLARAHQIIGNPLTRLTLCTKCYGMASSRRRMEEICEQLDNFLLVICLSLLWIRYTRIRHMYEKRSQSMNIRLRYKCVALCVRVLHIIKAWAEVFVMFINLYRIVTKMTITRVDDGWCFTTTFVETFG